MTDTIDTADRIDALIAHYGNGEDGSSPTRTQWARIFARDPAHPITLLNFFKLRAAAEYAPGINLAGSGQDAFERYAAVSIPSMEEAGGKFLMVAPFEGSFAGTEKDWDVIAVGSYPDAHALLTLYENSDYQEAYFHRTAACAAQEVLIGAA
ncbi:DUF1330 domain-containing protein [uncultured Roseobacter sp.]|uniref:DUF1330 domain-containing protein n=1 Tax=uncultured Roseobacter sp. TaxID=114847 RepID=UPI0026229411|nr:DUF1330 domain-containing protein [uncultured Roseobacter sp.]